MDRTSTDKNVGQFDPSASVSQLLALGVSPDGAAFLCAEYYRLCASVGGGDGGVREFYSDGRSANGNRFGGIGWGRFGDGGYGNGVVGRDCGCDKARGGPVVEVGVGPEVAGGVRVDGSAAGVREATPVDEVTPCAGGAAVVGEEKAEKPSVGKHNRRNRAKREKQKHIRSEWCKIGDGVSQKESRETGSSVGGSAQTVDTRTGVEIEAAQTLAARRVAENKLKILEAKAAAKLVEHRLRALNDKERTLVIDRLAAARLEEKINTSKKRSQASFKECGSPIDSVGSALSAHEFAFKQQIRQIDAEKKKVAYMEVQLKRYHSYSPDYVNQLVANIPEPYIPTEREMEEEDSDESPFLSYEEMQAEAANYQHG